MKEQKIKLNRPNLAEQFLNRFITRWQTARSKFLQGKIATGFIILIFKLLITFAL